MDEMKERVKRRALFRRGTLAPGRYVRFEVPANTKLIALSEDLGIEVAEAVRIAVDELFDRKALQAILKLKTSRISSVSKAAVTARVVRPTPKDIAVPRESKARVEYIPIEDMVTA